MQSKRRPPVAVLGYCMDLPSMPGMSGDDFVRVLQNRETLFQDYLETGTIDPREYSQDGNPWMYQHRKGHKYPKKAFWDRDFLQVSEKESKFMHGIQMMSLVISLKGLEVSGIPNSLLHKTRTGVFVAAQNIFGDFKSYPDETSLRGGLSSSISDRVAYFLGTHGPTLTVETACSSSLVALTIAVDSIRNGSCDVAIVATVNMSNPEYELSLQATGVISLKGECKPFDEDASGTLRCEGYGSIILCSMEWAEKNGYSGSIKGLIVNATIGSAGADHKASQGSGRVYEAPNVAGMVEMIRLCHEQVGLPLEKILYVEAHATGTKVGDLIELQALSDVYKNSHDIHQNPLRVGSIKGNIGHAELSAGMFSLIKVLEMFRKRTFFPTGGDSITPRTDFDWHGSNIKLCQEDEAFPSDEQIFIGVNSFGVGGSYAHAVVTEYPGYKVNPLRESTQYHSTQMNIRPLLFTISAASAHHLHEYERCLIEYLQDNDSGVSLLDMCGLFAVNRSKFSFFRSYLAESVEELRGQMASDSKGKALECSEHNRTIALAFTGQGSQWVSMGHGLMAFDAYRNVVTRFDELFRKLSGWSPLDKLVSLKDDQLADTMYAQPLTFMVQIGLIELLRYFGVNASVVIGHSAGEIAALYCCGMLSLADSAKVVFHRSKCQQALAGSGRMLAVQMDSAEAKAMLKDTSLGVSSCEIACINSPRSVVLAGPQGDLEKLQQLLASKQVKNTFLKGNTAFHSSSMDSILSEVERKLEFLNGRVVRQLDTQFVSTVTATPQSMLNSEYFVHNIRQPVRFHNAIRYLLNQYDPDVIVEIGPHKTLAPLIVECIQVEKQQASVLTSLARDQNDMRSFWQLIMGLTRNGIFVDLRRFYGDLGYRFAHVVNKRIPGHPFLPQEAQSLLVAHSGKILEKMDAGPASGTFESESNRLVTFVEITTATSAPMADHVMGGIAMLPGMYFVEAAIETWGLGNDDCISMVDVEFHKMCQIPDRSKNQDPRKLFVRHSSEKSNRLTSFRVESMTAQSPDTTVHCTGSIISFPRPRTLDGSQYIPGMKGFKERRLTTRDIGEEGIKSLLESHHSIYPDGTIYNIINEDGVAEYGPSFQVINDVRVRADGSSFLATMEFDHEQWMNRGGIFGVPLLDGILQLSILNPYIPSGNVGYAGGFELGIFVRKAVQNPCIVHFQFVEDDGRFGQTVLHGDALMYDSNGLLLCHFIGIKSIIGKQITKLCDAIPVWQPISIPMLHRDVFSKDPELDKTASSDDSQDIVATFINLLQRKRTIVQGEAIHVRILEYWDDDGSLPPVFESLVNVNEKVLPTDFSYLVEVFIATHEEKVLTKGYHIHPKHKQWLRVRLVSLPSGQEALDHFSIDMIASLGQDAGHALRDDPMELIRVAGRMGCQGSVLLHTLDVGNMWDGYVEHLFQNRHGFSCCILLSQALLATQPDRKAVYIVSCDNDLSFQIQNSIEQLAFDAAMEVVVNARSIECTDKPGICQLAEEVAREPGEKHVVVLNGIVDQSEYAQDTFTLVARIAHQLDVVQTTCFLWVITSHAFAPPIHVHRGSLLPLVTGLQMTLPKIRAKFVDHQGPYESLATLILSKRGPQQFMVDMAGIIHQRIMLPIEVELSRHRLQIRADDRERYFKCELVKSSEGSKACNYDFFAHKVKSPDAGEVLVDIKYASLNFRDIMLTLNALPRSSFEASYYGYNLGMEGSGTVVEVGEGVSHLAPGDNVAFSGKGTIASKIIVSADNMVMLKPAGISLEQGAGLLSVYATAYHALVELCQLKQGERVLIHAAAGGVGHAAISICAHIGAVVYVTSSQPKRGYCVDVLGVPESHVFSSRDVSWFDDVMRVTNDEGIDIVLNSLAGEHQSLGIQCLRPEGRFCEIGKADIFNNETLSLFAFRKNIRLFAIDMDRMAFENAPKMRKITERVFDGIYRGDYKCLPFTCFHMDRIKEAIEFMRAGSHIGKVMLCNYSKDGALTISSKRSAHFDEDLFHLILGGGGGFGYKMVRWLHKNGARKFITTVSKDPSKIRKMYQDLIVGGAIFEVVEADLSVQKDLERLEGIVMSHPIHGQVETMVHCAGIYEVFHLEDVSDNELNRQCDIKVQSALFLDQLSRKLGTVKHFIMVGSNSSEIVYPTLVTYAASNAMLASVARKRHSEDLPATILQMGSLKDVGIVAKDQFTLTNQKKVAVEFLNSARAVMAFEKMLEDNIDDVAHLFFVSLLSSKRLGLGWNGGHSTPLVDSLVVFGETKRAFRLVQATYNEILDRLIYLISNTLGIDQESTTASSSLSSMGMDSLSVLEFGQHVWDEFDYLLDRSAYAMTIGDISRGIYNKMKDAESKQAEEEHNAAGANIKQSTKKDTEDVYLNTDAKCLRRNHIIKNPKGYVIVVPGVDKKGLYFVDWKMDDIQVLTVDLQGTLLEPKTLAKKITMEMHADGYLKNDDTKIVVLGYSFGAFIALEMCKVLVVEYSFNPVGLIPVCFAAPHACKSPFHHLPKRMQRALMERTLTRRLKREYGAPHSEDTGKGRMHLQMLHADLVGSWEAAEGYCRKFSKNLQHHQYPYLGSIPIHYIYALKDQIGNPKRISDPGKHGWGELTSGDFEVSSWYGMHFSIMNPATSSIFRDHILNAVEAMIK